MASSLQISAAGDALNLYAVLRRRSDAKVWSTVSLAWESWSDASIDDYDTPLTSKGGDLYWAVMPPQIIPGTQLRVTYYKRSGSTPAITDLIIDTQSTEAN